MAATRLVSGILREIWQESAGQPGGPPQTIVTGIRLSNEQKQRVRATLVIDTVVGPALASASGDVTSDGFLQIRVFNGVGGTSISWTLDVQLTHSMQQALDHRTPTPDVYIAVVNGFGVGGTASAQNLAQTYDLGAAAADQRMVISTAKGGGVVVEASTAAVTADGGSLEIRQNAAFAVPFVIRRVGNIAGGPNAQFAKARGTLPIPAAVQSGDELATIDYYGFPVAAYTLDARIVTACVSAAPTYGTGFEFHLTPRSGALGLAMKLNGDGVGSNTVLTLYNSPEVVSSADHSGRLGEASLRWASAHIDTVNAYSNVCLGGAAIGGGALQTVLLPNTATMPVPQANQVYLGSKDWAGSPFGGIAGATFEVVAEALVQAAGAAPADTLIPIRYNGADFVLLAIAADGG